MRTVPLGLLLREHPLRAVGQSGALQVWQQSSVRVTQRSTLITSGRCTEWPPTLLLLLLLLRARSVIHEGMELSLDHSSHTRAPLERAARSAGARALELYCYGPAGVRSSELYYVGDVPMPGTTLAVKQSGLPEPAEQYIDKCMRAT